MENQPGALGRVVDAVVLWNSRCTEVALSDLKRSGTRVDSCMSPGCMRYSTPMFTCLGSTISHSKNELPAGSSDRCVIRLASKSTGPRFLDGKFYSSSRATP